jgi:hypothetical protein
MSAHQVEVKMDATLRGFLTDEDRETAAIRGVGVEVPYGNVDAAYQQRA